MTYQPRKASRRKLSLVDGMSDKTCIALFDYKGEGGYLYLLGVNSKSRVEYQLFPSAWWYVDIQVTSCWQDASSIEEPGPPERRSVAASPKQHSSSFEHTWRFFCFSPPCCGVYRILRGSPLYNTVPVGWMLSPFFGGTMRRPFRNGFPGHILKY